MEKDWTGNKASIFKTIGASNHTDHERQKDDYYATDPIATIMLCGLERFTDDVWEPACGEGHISKVLAHNGYRVRSSDIVNRGYGDVSDFLSTDNVYWHGDIITNPPYKYAQEFVEKSLQIIDDGNKVAMFLKLTFLEGKSRKELFRKYPPKVVYVSSGRIKCAMNGDFDSIGSSATAYAWFIWEKGYDGDTIIKWFN